MKKPTKATMKKIGILMLLILIAGGGFAFWKWKQSEKEETEDTDYEEVEEKTKNTEILDDKGSDLTADIQKMTTEAPSGDIPA